MIELRWRLAPGRRYRKPLHQMLCLLIGHKIQQRRMTLWGEMCCLQPYCGRCCVSFTDEDVGLPEWND